jgi:hypothetical protein
MGRAHVFNQGLTGLVLQFLQGWGSDMDRQAFGAGLKVAWALSLKAEHDLSQAGVSPSFRVHLWPAEASAQVRADTGNRPCGHLPLPSQGSQPRAEASVEASCTAVMHR